MCQILYVFYVLLWINSGFIRLENHSVFYLNFKQHHDFFGIGVVKKKKILAV